MPGSRSLLVTSQKESAEFDRLKVQNLKVTNALNTDNVISDQVFVFENFYLYNATLNIDSNTITVNKDDILATVWSDRPYKIKINLSDDDAVELLRASFDESLGNYSYKNNNPNMVVMINNSVVILTLKDYSLMGDEVTFFYENNFNSQIVDNYTGKISMFIDTLPLFKLISTLINKFGNIINDILTFNLMNYNAYTYNYLSKCESEYYYRINIVFTQTSGNRIYKIGVTLSLGTKQLANLTREESYNDFRVGILWNYINTNAPLLLGDIKNSNRESNSNFNFVTSETGRDILDDIPEDKNDRNKWNWKFFSIFNLSGPTNKFTYISNGRNGNLFTFGQGFNAIFETKNSRIRIDRVNNALSIIQINLDGFNLVINNIEQLNNFEKEFFGVVYYQNENLNINENSVLTIITNGPINNL